MLSISRSHGYKIIRELNHELQEKGYRTITGKVSCKYLTRSSTVCRQLKEGE